MAILTALLVVPFVGLAMNAASAAEPAAVIPAPTSEQSAKAGTQTIVLAGGCFWGVQAVFQHTKGVTSAVSGYAGGEKQTAHYEMVGSGQHRTRRVGRRDLRSAADFATARFCKSTSPSRIIRPSSTAKDRTSARNTGRPSSMPTTSRRDSLTPTSPSSTRRMPFRGRSRPGSRRCTASIPPKTTTRTSPSCTRPIPTSCSMTCPRSTI